MFNRGIRNRRRGQRVTQDQRESAGLVKSKLPRSHKTKCCRRTGKRSSAKTLGQLAAATATAAAREDKEKRVSNLESRERAPSCVGGYAALLSVTFR